MKPFDDKPIDFDLRMPSGKTVSDFLKLSSSTQPPSESSPALLTLPLSELGPVVLGILFNFLCPQNQVSPIEFLKRYPSKYSLKVLPLEVQKWIVAQSDPDRVPSKFPLDSMVAKGFLHFHKEPDMPPPPPRPKRKVKSKIGLFNSSSSSSSHLCASIQQSSHKSQHKRPKI